MGGICKNGKIQVLNERNTVDCGPVRDAFGRNVLFGLGFVPPEHFLGSFTRQCVGF